jgi:hypothetical protein
LSLLTAIALHSITFREYCFFKRLLQTKALVLAQ